MYKSFPCHSYGEPFVGLLYTAGISNLENAHVRHYICSAVVHTKTNKMAADESAMDINEVVELVLNGSSDEENDESSTDDTESSSEAAFMEKLASFLDSLRGETALNIFFFMTQLWKC